MLNDEQTNLPRLDTGLEVESQSVERVESKIQPRAQAEETALPTAKAAAESPDRPFDQQADELGNT